MRSPTYSQKKRQFLELQNTELKSVIKSLLEIMDDNSCGVDTWPSEHKYNVLTLSLKDLNMFEKEKVDDKSYRCIDCMIEIPKWVADKAKNSPRCNSCYTKRKAKLRGGK